MKTQEVTYKTEVTTAVVPEPRVADVPPVVVSEYDVQRRMAQQAHMMQTFITERVKPVYLKVITPACLKQINIKYPVISRNSRSLLSSRE